MSLPVVVDYIPQASPVVTEEGSVKKSVTVGAGQVLVRGTVMAQKTVGGQFFPYSHAAADGTQYAVGVLAQNVDTTNNGNVATSASMYVRGTFWYSKLTGTDSYFVGLFSSMQQQQVSKLDILCW